jgi:hypothetical protein
MRYWFPAVLATSLVLTGCPTFLSDWTIAASNGKSDAGRDANLIGRGGHGAASHSGTGRSSRSGVNSGSGGSSDDSLDGSAESSSSSGSVGSGGSPPSQDGSSCALVMHSNGLGQTWQDCAPLGTYDAQEAAKACIAFTGSRDNCYNSPGCADAPWVVQAIDPEQTYDILWGYTGSTAGYVGVNGACPNSFGRSWE